MNFYVFQIYYDSVNLVKIFKLHNENDDIIDGDSIKKSFNIFLVLQKLMINIVSCYVNIINKFFGFQDLNLIFSSSLIDVEGKILFDDERHFFDLELTAARIEDFITLRPLSFQHIEYLINDRYVSSLVYHYISNGLFFNSFVDFSMFFLRKIKPFLQFLKNSIIGIANLTSHLGLPRSTTCVNYDSTVRDTFFESQEFKHSLSFEFV